MKFVYQKTEQMKWQEQNISHRKNRDEIATNKEQSKENAIHKNRNALINLHKQNKMKSQESNSQQEQRSEILEIKRTIEEC